MKYQITLTNSEIEHRITENIHSDRDRHIMRMKLVDGLTYERIAEIVEMTPRQIQNIARKYRFLFEPDKVIFTEICFS